MIQGTAVSNIPPPLIASSGQTVTHGTVIMNNQVPQNIPPIQGPLMNPAAVCQSNTQINQQNQTVQINQQQMVISSNQNVPASTTCGMISRVVTPTPASSTPPPTTRPATPHQVATTQDNVRKTGAKLIKTVLNPTTTPSDVENKPSTSQEQQLPKTITIKIDPNSFLCEWRGCLK